MNSIPRQLQTIVPVEEIIKVKDWWGKLSEENQLELRSIYSDDFDNMENHISIQLCGKFVEQEKVNSNDVFWVNHFYDYIISHELYLDKSPAFVGGICSANKSAELAIRNGIIPKDFICSAADENCQMKKILDLKDGKKSFQFYLRFKLENKTLLSE